MCSSPHEMTSAHIETYLEAINEWLDDPTMPASERRIWEGRRENFIKVLKERAEKGTYNTVGVY